MSAPKPEPRYKRVRFFYDSFHGRDELAETAAEGWSVIPGTVASSEGKFYLLMERGVSSRSEESK